MITLHAIALVFAVIRMVELVTVDTLFAPLRERWPKLWACPRCVSVWAGMVATALYIGFPYGNWPFALSMLYILYNIGMARLATSSLIQGRGIVIDIDAKGDARLVRADLPPPELALTMRKIAEALERS